jgi:4-amino-4-deoxy-L-arabinose transferase-like glycosyltransferase
LSALLCASEKIGRKSRSVRAVADARTFDRTQNFAVKKRVPTLAKFRVPLALALFVCCLWLYTRHNDFPFFYHPDEPDKARQIIDGQWNFHHPALMLAATKAAIFVFRVPLDPQHVTVTGRWLSATFCAIAVVSLALLAWRLRGPMAFFAVALLAGLHHQVFELAHYFKEDAALLMGIAIAFLALDRFLEKRSAPAAALLGLACAIALSAKYLGVVMLIPAGIALARSQPGKRAALVVSFAAALLLATAAANYPLIANLATFQQSFHRELTLAAAGQGGMTHRIPNTEYFPIFGQNMNPALWLLLAVFVFTFLRDRKRKTFGEWTVVVFPFAYLLLLACSPKSNDRYFLPAAAFFALLAAFGLMETARILSPKIGARFAWLACFAVAASFSVYSLFQYDIAFAHDDRRELSDWIRANLPATAVLAQDSRVGLPTPDREERLPWQPAIPQRVIGVKLKSATLDELRASGVTHVAVSESDYGRYFRRAGRAREEFQSEFAQRRAFYESLFERGEKLWSRPRGTVIYLHPGLELYRLPAR